MAKFSVEFAHLFEPSPTLHVAVIQAKDKAVFDSELGCILVGGLRIPITSVKEYKLSMKAVAPEPESAKSKAK